jgi:hypothetical protein
MEAVCSYATSTDFYKSERNHVQDDDIFHIHRRENLKYRNAIKFAINCTTLRYQAPVTAAVLGQDKMYIL